MMWRIVILMLFSMPMYGQQGILLASGSGGNTGNLLLDSFPNAEAAYSVRLLNSSYSGYCIQLQRKSDNVNLDIGFSGEIIDTSSIISFCAASGCWVSIWYDQSGNGRNLTGLGTGYYPDIYNTGLIHTNGNPSLLFSGDELFNSAVPSLSTNNITIFTVATNSAGSPNFLFDHSSAAANRLSIVQISGTQWRLYDGSSLYFNSITGQQVIYVFRDSVGNGRASVNGNIDSTGSIGTDNSSGITLGNAGSGTYSYFGYVQELIVYHIDMSAEKSSIVNNINNYYSIY